MADRRTYVRLNDGLPDNPKILDVGDLAGWLYVCGLCYCSRQLTDGVIPVAMVGRLTGLANYEAIASDLLEANLWHAPGHECKRCPQPLAGTYIVHDYLDHQRSAAEVKDLSEKRAAAGQRGGKASGESRRGEANREANAVANAKQARSKNEAETETETELKKKTSSSSTGRRRSRAAARPVAARFDDFYRVYPRREAPADAEVAWTKAIEDVGADPQTVIDAAISYAMARKGKDPTYTKLPATWLNKRCWEDEATPAYNARSNGYQPYLEDAADQRPWAGEL